MLSKRIKVQNAIITLGNTDDSGKGRHFKSRFIQPGLAGYPGQFGNALIKKENIDKFVWTLRGKPIIINHKDKIEDKDKVGIVNNVWFNPDDGWYWCDGIIFDDEAINLINNGWSVSCAYDFTKADNSGGTENNIPYDIEFLDGEFNHLALVNNPRYEGANIVFNSKVENEDKWITIKPNGEDAKGKHLLLKDGETVEDAMHRNGWYKKRQVKEEKNKKTVEEIKQDYINGKISAKEAEKLLPKDTDTTSLAIAKYNKEHGIKDFDFDDNKQSDTKDGEEIDIEIDPKDLDWIKTQPMEKIPSIIEAYKKIKRDKIETEKKHQQILKEQAEKERAEKSKRDKELLDKYEKGKELSEKKAQTMTLEEYLDSKGIKARKGPIYELHKYDWEQAQNSLTDTILNAIAELMIGE